MAAVKTQRDSGIDMMDSVLIKEAIMCEVTELDAALSRPSSLQYLDDPVVLVGKDQDLIKLDITEVDQLSDTDDEPSQLSREAALQMLIDGERDIADAVALATELAILEDLEEFEPLPALTTSYHDNVINMHTSSQYTLQSATYEIEEAAISQGQDPCGVCHVGFTQRYTSNKGSLEFLCGRSPSADVADWWSHKVPNSTSASPSSLNFAFTGTLSLTVYGESLLGGADKLVFPDFGLAQGYADRSTTTWHFGSADEGSAKAMADGTLRVSGWSSAWGNFVEAYFRLPKNVSDTVELLSIEYVWPASS